MNTFLPRLSARDAMESCMLVTSPVLVTRSRHRVQHRDLDLVRGRRRPVSRRRSHLQGAGGGRFHRRPPGGRVVATGSGTLNNDHLSIKVFWRFLLTNYDTSIHGGRD